MPRITRHGHLLAPVQSDLQISSLALARITRHLQEELTPLSTPNKARVLLGLCDQLQSTLEAIESEIDT